MSREYNESKKTNEPYKKSFDEVMDKEYSTKSIEREDVNFSWGRVMTAEEAEKEKKALRKIKLP